MKKLIVVRHAEYVKPRRTQFGIPREQPSASLSERGKVQARSCAERLQEYVQGGKKAKLVTASLPRTKETATIMGHILGTPLEECAPLLFDLYSAGEDQMVAVEHVAHGFDVLIVVVPQESVSGLVNAFCEQRFNQKFGLRPFDYCCGMILNLKTGELTEIH